MEGLALPGPRGAPAARRRLVQPQTALRREGHQPRGLNKSVKTRRVQTGKEQHRFGFLVFLGLCTRVSLRAGEFARRLVKAQLPAPSSFALPHAEELDLTHFVLCCRVRYINLSSSK